MANILILQPSAVSTIAVSRGSGAANLLTPDPKEIWLDGAVGSAATIDLDFGFAVAIDTVFLGYVIGPAAGATWTITGGLSGYAETVLKAGGALRVADSAGQAPSTSHGLWTGASATVRYLRVSVTQPAGNTPLSAGVVMAGACFQPAWNKEWGSGRGVIDTGVSTRLPGGGFANVPGARLGSYNWTLGDLSSAEVDALYAIAQAVGETSPVLVIEDPAATVGLRNRIHYGLFKGLRPFERRNPKQTRWDFKIEEWI